MPHRGHRASGLRRTRWLRAAALALPVWALVLAPSSTHAATVLSRDVRISIGDDGSVTERIAVRVRLDEAGDLASWSPYVIPLDVNRTLLSASGSARRPDGSLVVLGEEHMETVEGVGGDGILHSSAGARLLRFPPLPAGSELAVAYEVREEPWFESGAVRLTGDEPVERLSVRVEAAPGSAARDGLRWHLDGSGGDGEADEDEDPEGVLEPEETEAGLRLEATGVSAEDVVLRYAWGPVASWPAVAGWYRELVETVPRGGDDVRTLARERASAVEHADDPRALAEELLETVRSRVRYVAVEVGVGGYRPSPPGEVLERRWGDCKDKAFLLIDLLAEVGIEAYPALVLLSEGGAVEAEFPSADQFNHLIVAVPEEEVPPRPGDVAGDGYLFLDPTQDRGGLTWVHPALQGQRALVVRGEGSGLATVPVLGEREAKRLEVRLTVVEDGTAGGEAVLRLSGHGAWALSAGTAAAAPAKLSEVARGLLGGLLDGAEVGTPRWRQGESEDGVPLVELSAPVRFHRLVAGRTVPSFSLSGPSAFPEPSELRDLADPLATRPGSWTAIWEIDLPAGWCPPDGPELSVDNPLGAFRQQVTPVDGGVRVEREARLAVRWIAPEDAEAARELALAETRTAKRRLRLGCD